MVRAVLVVDPRVSGSPLGRLPSMAPGAEVVQNPLDGSIVAFAVLTLLTGIHLPAVPRSGGV